MSRINLRNTTGLLAIAASVALTAFAGVSQAQEPAKSWQTGIHRTDLLKRDLDVAGREVIQVLVDIDPGVSSPKHSHPGVEVAYVLEGTFEYQLEGQPPVTLKAGESLYIPAGTAHVAKNVGAGKASELATYIVKKGVPAVELSK
ncbi:cupin domain-containing protein [Pseudomonas sp. MPC6]|jgi:quercetin dioxygenase-like cupin family protein|uniref:cupin domain-containing protein n=1 Tax=unclassified Pseudomonas TaxID=196821 RepID=UPI00111017CB|nr:cupin domain-containing protein [Pseudomonas sp. MPC6]QCY11989.1 cupin domain-containing protein [Pseudomonas sp. MPC6]